MRTETALPDEARSHHTVWLRQGEKRAVPVRYAVAGGHLVCFGDAGLTSVADGGHLTATVHAIACGPPLVAFDVTVRQVPPDEVDMASIGDLLVNVMGGDGTMAGAVRWLDAQRHSRRVLELVP